MNRAPRSTPRSVLLALSSGLFCAPACVALREPIEPVTAFVGATLVEVESGALLGDQTVLVAGERIERIGPRDHVAVPAGARVVDARGRFLLPGLCDSHGHLPDAEPADALTLEEYCLLELAAGVTTVRSMRGTELELGLRQRLARGELAGPNLLVAGLVSDVDAGGAAQRVDELARAGYDLVKLTGGVDDEAHRALAAAARAYGLPFAGHVPDAVALESVLASGQCVEHCNGFARAWLQGASPSALAREAARAGVANCPTLTFSAIWWRLLDERELRALEGVELMPRADVERWETWLADARPPADELAAAQASWPRRLEFIGALGKSGACLLLGASHGPWIVPGFGLRQEMRLFRQAGLSNAAILRAATLGCAEFMGQDEDWGRLRAGQRADLLLLEADPLASLENLDRIAAVCVRGRLYDRAFLDAVLERLRRR